MPYGSQAIPILGRRFPPVRNCYRQFYAQHDFPVNTGISNWYSGSDLTVVTNNYRIGSAALKMAIPAGQTQVRYYTSAQWSSIDASAGFEVEVSWFNPPDATPTGNITVGLSSGGSVNNFWLQNVTKEPGWRRARFDSYASVGGSWNANAITGWQVLFSGTAGQYIIVDQIIVRKKSTRKPILVWRNDDAHSSVMSMAAYAEKYGHKFIVGVIGATIGTSNYCTLAQLRDLDARGHLICNHTYSHLDWTAHSINTIEADVARGYDYLVKNRLSRGAGVLICPYYWQAPAGQEYEWMQRCLNMSDIVLTSIPKYPAYPISGNTTNYGQPNWQHDLRLLPNATSDASATADYIQNTITTRVGKISTLLYHHLDAGGITTANFRLAVDKAAELDAARTIDVLTLEEALLRFAVEEYS